MKALPLLLALLLAWLAVASGYHLVDAPHFLGGGGPAPLRWIICFPSAIPESQHFAVAVAFLGLPGLSLLAWLAFWSRSQRHGDAGQAGGHSPAGHGDPWLAG